MLRTGLVVSMLLALLVVVPVRADFQDPLDTPASQSTLAVHGVFNGLAMAGQRIVAVGQRGHILVSDDCGGSWQQAAVPVSVDLTAVQFPDSSHGWAVGHGGVVLSSSDGGLHWSRQLDGRAIGKLMADYYAQHPPEAFRGDAHALDQLNKDVQRFVDEGPDKPFLDVWFENEHSGFVVGAFNLIFHTDDGGKTWVPWFDRSDNPKLFNLYAIHPVGADLYVAGEQGLLLKLDRGAGRFRALALGYQGSLFGVIGKPGAVLAFGLRGKLFRSGDGGASWTSVETGLPVALTAGTVTPDGRVVLVSQAGHALVSGDDGRSFSPIPLEQRSAAGAVAALDDHTLVLAGARGLRVQHY
jgi:photosystem II stability/assembly factor-like uncharacterized protein